MLLVNVGVRVGQPPLLRSGQASFNLRHAAQKLCDARFFNPFDCLMNRQPGDRALFFLRPFLELVLHAQKIDLDRGVEQVARFCTFEIGVEADRIGADNRSADAGLFIGLVFGCLGWCPAVVDVALRDDPSLRFARRNEKDPQLVVRDAERDDTRLILYLFDRRLPLCESG